jgi:hypothetical protein
MIRRQFRLGVLHAPLALVLLLAWAPSAAAQGSPPRERKNSAYAEVLGASLGTSINYERMLTSRFNVRIGGGFAFDDSNAYPEVIAMANVVLGSRRHQFTAGVGALGLFPYSGCGSCTSGADWTLVSDVGYRFSADSGFLLKATLALVAFRGESFSDSVVFPIPGVSLGWRF